MLRTRLTALAAAAAALLALTGCSAGTSPSTPDAGADDVIAINVGITPIINAANVYVGMEEGIFERHGLDVTPVVVQNTSTAIPSLINGELQVALINAVAAVTAGSKGLPIQIVSGSDRYPTEPAEDTTAIVVKPDSGISDVTDLAGTTIAIVGLKSGPELATRVLLDEAGVDLASVNFVELAYPDMVAAVEAGRVDAAFIVDPFLSNAKAAGLEVVAQPFTEGIGGMNAMTWVASESYIGANAEAIERFTAAIQEAADFSNDNPESVRAVLPEFTTLSEASIENAVLGRYDSSLSVEDLEAWSAILVKYGFIEEEFDTSGLIWHKP